MSFFKNLFASEAPAFKQMVDAGALVIDVRSAGEYAAGHINGSINMPLETLQYSLGDIRRRQQPVITVCRSGTRSSMAEKMLSSAGIKAFNGGPWTKLGKLLQ